MKSHIHEPNPRAHALCNICGIAYRKPLIVGEANPYGLDPRLALYPRPERASGYRLAVTIMGMRETKYLASFERVNLCPQRWSIVVARDNAKSILGDTPRPTILLGAKVCAAFGVQYEPFMAKLKNFHRVGRDTWATFIERPFVILPHPSGLNMMWNEPGAIKKARAALHAAHILAIGE